MLDKIGRIQDKIGTLVKDTKAYNYKYVDLNQILEKLQPLLREEGLILTQPIINGEVYTLIQTVEKDGGALQSSIKLPENVKPQDMGSAITYFRRYTLVSLLALSAEDDDGAKASAGLNVKEWAKIRDAYQNEGKITPDDWTRCSIEQQKIITEIKKSKLKANE